MKISFDVPDQHAAKVVDAFADVFFYQDTVDGEPNPETKQQFAKRKLIDYMREIVARNEADKAARSVEGMEIT